VTHEDGVRFVDENGIVQAEFGAGDGCDQSWKASADIVVRRGKLAQALYDATMESALSQ
jgi:major membrane immunogen (membrane-anchored lipoprotein)